MVWDGNLVVWGGLGCFGVVWGVSTDPPRTKLHMGKTNPESLEEIHLSTKKRQQKVFFCLLLARNVSHVTRKFTPPTLILLLEHMADFGFEIIQFTFFILFEQKYF